MNKDERKVPELRFKDFHDDWEQRKFKELVNRISHSSANMDLPRVEYEDITSDRGELNKDISLKRNNKRGTAFVPKDILFGKLRPYLNKWLHPNFNGIAVGDFWVLRSKGIESKFIFYMMQTKQFKLISNISSGSKMPRSDWNIVSNSKFSIPLNSSEDKKISVMLSTIENLITLHQRKINILEQCRKNYLILMFPNKFDNTPVIRFRGFHENWNYNKLSNYLITSKEKNINGFYDKNDVLSVSGIYGVVNQIKFQGRSFAGKSVLNYGVLYNGNIVYTKSPLKFAPHGIIKTNKGRDGIVSTLYAIYKVRENTNPDFIQTYFDNDLRLNKYLKPLVNKGAKNDMKVTDEYVLNGLVSFPNIKEQKKISLLIEKTEKLIKVNRMKADILKKIKKLYLHKMFL